MSVLTPYPWQQNQWQSMNSRAQKDILPHGLLLCGPAGLGKQHLAEVFSRQLLCQQPSAQGPCGSCKSCQMLTAGSHPDFLSEQPADEGKPITVDQIREVVHFLTLKPHYAGKKIALISPAEQMNVNASNSLLKSLEEPPANALLILVSSRPAALLPTIRSRTQEISFSVPRQQEAQAWLQQQAPDCDSQLLLSLANGSPLLALEFAETDMLEHRERLLKDLEGIASRQQDAVQVAEAWFKLDIRTSLYWMSSWVADMLRLKATETPPFVGNPDLTSRLQTLANLCGMESLMKYYQHINECGGWLAGNMNGQMLLEELLINWLAVSRSGQKVATKA